MQIQVGLVGYGLAGSVFHGPLIEKVEGLELAAVVSTRAEKVHRDYPNVEVVPTFDQLLQNAAIDLVVIASPNLTHYEFAKKAILAKKHVVVDKPFVITTQEADELIELAEANGVLLSVYQNRRWDNDFLTIQSLLKTNMLGDLATYEAHFDRYRPHVQNRWREQDIVGSGSLYDLGSHLIDQALVLLGMPKSVSATLEIQREGGKAFDYFHLVLDYGHLKAILHSGALVRQLGPRFQLHGSQGSFVKYGLDPQEDWLRQGKRPGGLGWGEDSPEQYGQLTVQMGELSFDGKVPMLPGRYTSYYEGIAAAITSGQPLPVFAVEARNVIKIIECAIESHQEQRVVPVS
jgi:scyllo-inositol 2-dehydrogenase (NADP+)